MIDPLITLIISLSLALLFFMAARHKMNASRQFQSQLAAYELLPEALVPIMAKLLPLIEMALVFLLLIPLTRPVAALMAMLLLAVYATAMGINLLRGRSEIDCGCGGEPQVLSDWLMLRNFVLMIGSGLLLVPVSDRAVGAADTVLLILMTAVLAMAYLLVEQLVRNQAVLSNRSSNNG